MKKTIVMLLLAVFCLASHAQNALFTKYENTQGVSTVVVSKAMFRAMPNMNVGNHNIKKIASKIDNLKVMSCERHALIAKISKDAVLIYNRHPWEEVMRYKDGPSNTIIYMQPLGRGKYEYVLYTTDKGALEIIDIVGNITLQEIKSITD